MIQSIQEQWLWLRKPAMLPVFPPHEDPGGDCLLARLLVERPAQRVSDLGSWPAGFEGGILHRLDTATSGLVVVARNHAAWEDGRVRFAGHRLRKRYVLLTDHDVPWDDSRVDHPIAHDARRRSKMVWQRSPHTPHRGHWYESRTDFRRLGPSGRWSAWEAVIETGVTHQIRVHAASVGLPVLGDRLYGGAPDPRRGERFYLHHRGIDGWPDSPFLEPEDWPP